MKGRHPQLREGRVRGFVCHGFVEYMQTRLGVEATAERLRSHVDFEASGFLRPEEAGLGFLPSRWYPASLLHELLDAALAHLPEERRRVMAARAGRFVFERQISGLQRALFSLFLSPARYARHASKAWDHNFGSGRVLFEERPHSHISHYVEWKEHHPVICRAMMIGRLEVYKSMGKRDARTYVERCDPIEGCCSRVYWGPRGDDEPALSDARVDDDPV